MSPKKPTLTNRPALRQARALPRYNWSSGMGGQTHWVRDDTYGEMVPHGDVLTFATENADAQALDQIAAILTGESWDADTIDLVAAFVRGTGRAVRDL